MDVLSRLRIKGLCKSSITIKPDATTFIAASGFCFAVGIRLSQSPAIPLERGEQDPNPLIVPQTLGDIENIGDTPITPSGEKSPVSLSLASLLPPQWEKARVRAPLRDVFPEPGANHEIQGNGIDEVK